MSQYTILPQYDQVVSDGVIYTLVTSTYTILKDVHAVQILDDYVDIEYTTNIPNNTTTSVTQFQDIINKVETLKKPIIIPPTLDETKKSASILISNFLIDQLLSGFTTNDIKMNAAFYDIQKLQLAYDFAIKTNKTAIDIVDYNNVVHSDTDIKVVDKILIDLMQNYQTLFTKKQELRIQINAATDIATIEAITW